MTTDNLNQDLTQSLKSVRLAVEDYRPDDMEVVIVYDGFLARVTPDFEASYRKQTSQFRVTLNLGTPFEEEHRLAVSPFPFLLLWAERIQNAKISFAQFLESADMDCIVSEYELSQGGGEHDEPAKLRRSRNTKPKENLDDNPEDDSPTSSAVDTSGIA